LINWSFFVVILTVCVSIVNVRRKMRGEEEEEEEKRKIVLVTFFGFFSVLLVKRSKTAWIKNSINEMFVFEHCNYRSNERRRTFDF